MDMNSTKKLLLETLIKYIQTHMDLDRIKKNLEIKCDDIVEYCINLIKKKKVV